jgi:hypothetical protein
MFIPFVQDGFVHQRRYNDVPIVFIVNQGEQHMTIRHVLVQDLGKKIHGESLLGAHVRVFEEMAEEGKLGTFLAVDMSELTDQSSAYERLQ